jgi:hypothetical protein
MVGVLGRLYQLLNRNQNEAAGARLAVGMPLPDWRAVGAEIRHL